MQSQVNANRLPVYLLTGFLGSGKTTLLNYLVKQPEMARTLVIINEFGSVSLDHLLVSHTNEDVIVELGSGCLCCTIRGDLAKTLRDIHWRFSRHGQRQFDRVIIETTGLAEPAPIVHTLITDNKLNAMFRLQGVITTVDILHAEATLDRHPESQKQVAVADLLLITKTDFATAQPHQVAALTQRLQQLNPAATIAQPQAGQLDPNAILSLDHIEPVQSATPLNQWLNLASFAPLDHATAMAANPFLDNLSSDLSSQNDVNRHNTHIKAYCFTFDTPLQHGRLEGWLTSMMQMMGANMLRIKGIINLAGFPGPMVIHGVQHIFHQSAFLPEWPDADRKSKLVFITYDIEREALERSIAAFLR
ncbi:ATP-binding protein [Alishewanella longhuensis]|uniref:ATP-binding protein n=1 Tax=Alishewanella longhuensis TaxID=1091037 RepID=A0ABQ3KYK8_9ALTE|nr:GTP-binding protein [Alishewanella longhuensis]GHG70315.1 ATP-binding protein [Alishewanella longhuensis]